MQYISDIKEIDLEAALGLASKGIDVFNASDEFFNNIIRVTLRYVINLIILMEKI